MHMNIITRRSAPFDIIMHVGFIWTGVNRPELQG